MKLEMELKPGDVVLLKFLACLLIIFFSFRFFVFPGIEKHQDLVRVKEEKQIQKDEMEKTIEDRPVIRNWQNPARASMNFLRIRKWMNLSPAWH